MVESGNGALVLKDMVDGVGCAVGALRLCRRVLKSASDLRGGGGCSWGT